MKTLLESLHVRKRSVWRISYQAEGCSLIELLVAIVGGLYQPEISQALVARFGFVQAIARATCDESGR